jgi:hypothetical protein
MAGERGKLKLGKGAGAFVKRRLLWLPQQDVAREADFCPLPDLLEGHQLWLGMVVGQHDGSILAEEIIEQPPNVNDLADLLANAMLRPLTDDHHGRPSTFYLRDNPEWEPLFPHLKQLKIEVVITDALPHWDEAVAEFIRYMQDQRSVYGEEETLSESQLGYRDELFDLRIAAILFPSNRRDRKQEQRMLK